jgi:hypothetical protein
MVADQQQRLLSGSQAPGAFPDPRNHGKHQQEETEMLGEGETGPS